MRYLTLLLICLSFTMSVFAGNTTTQQQVYNKARDYYAQGLTKKGNDAIALFEKAQEGFKICKNLCEKSLFKQLDKDDLKRWIAKCEDEIRLKRQQEIDEQEKIKHEAVERAKIAAAERAAAERAAAERAAAERAAAERAKSAAAERAAAERAAAELEARKQKRIESQLVRVESNAYLFDREYDLRSSVAGALSDAGFNQTDNPNDSRWSVYVTAVAYEDDIVEKPYLKNNKKYYDNEYWSGVNVRVKIVDDINGNIIYENEILDGRGDYAFYNKSFEKAAEDCYEALKPKLREVIVNNLKQNR